MNSQIDNLKILTQDTLPRFKLSIDVINVVYIDEDKMEMTISANI